VARHLGFAWTEPDASGLQSLVWRAAWEQTGEEALKQKLLRYNLEDCSALRLVTDALFALGAGQGPGSASSVGPPAGPAVARVEDLDTLAYPRRSGSIDFVNPDFEAINKCAYFDYQRERVYVRTSRILRRNTRAIDRFGLEDIGRSFPNSIHLQGVLSHGRVSASRFAPIPRPSTRPSQRSRPSASVNGYSRLNLLRNSLRRPWI